VSWRLSHRRWEIQHPVAFSLRIQLFFLMGNIMFIPSFRIGYLFYLVFFLSIIWNNLAQLTFLLVVRYIADGMLLRKNFHNSYLLYASSYRKFIFVLNKGSVKLQRKISYLILARILARILVGSLGNLIQNISTATLNHESWNPPILIVADDHLLPCFPVSKMDERNVLSMHSPNLMSFLW